jgi:hypothetical protein
MLRTASTGEDEETEAWNKCPNFERAHAASIPVCVCVCVCVCV